MPEAAGLWHACARHRQRHVRSALWHHWPAAATAAFLRSAKGSAAARCPPPHRPTKPGGRRDPRAARWRPHRLTGHPDETRRWRSGGFFAAARGRSSWCWARQAARFPKRSELAVRRGLGRWPRSAHRCFARGWPGPGAFARSDGCAPVTGSRWWCSGAWEVTATSHRRWRAPC